MRVLLGAGVASNALVFTIWNVRVVSMIGCITQTTAAFEAPPRHWHCHWHRRPQSTSSGGRRGSDGRGNGSGSGNSRNIQSEPPWRVPRNSRSFAESSSSSSSTITSSNPGRERQAQQKRHREENRLAELLAKKDNDNDNDDNNGGDEKDSTSSAMRTMAEQKELAGLLQKQQTFEEQYDATSFSLDHQAFKRAHNQAFCQLAKYCHAEHVFFLDGPDGATTRILTTISRTTTMTMTTTTTTTTIGDEDEDEDDASQQQPQPPPFTLDQCHVPNRHPSTCETLRRHLGLTNVYPMDATAALRDPLLFVASSIHIGAFYLDGCGSYTPHIIEMVEAAMDQQHVHPPPPPPPPPYLSLDPSAPPPERVSSSTTTTTTTTAAVDVVRPKRRIVIGFSICGGGREVVNKEQEIVQAMVRVAKRQNQSVLHVLDDPERWGVDAKLQKLSAEGTTLTSWFVLEDLWTTHHHTAGDHTAAEEGGE